MPTVKYSDFDLDKLTFTTPEENKKIPEITKYQLMSMPTYTVAKDDSTESSLPTIQGPWIHLDYYGVPSKNDKDGKPRLNQAKQPLTDRERGKLKVPFNMDDPASKALYELLTSVDKKCEASKEELFGDKKKAAGYRYQPIVRKAPEDLDAPEDAEPKPDYFVIKFDFDIKTGDVKSKLYLNEDGDRTEVTVKTLDDVTKHLRYKCEFRPIFTFNKLYSTKAVTDGKRSYGLGLKLKMVEVKPVVSTKADSETFFIDTDEEDEVERKELVTQTTKKDEEEPAKKTAGRRKGGKSTVV